MAFWDREVGLRAPHGLWVPPQATSTEEATLLLGIVCLSYERLSLPMADIRVVEKRGSNNHFFPHGVCAITMRTLDVPQGAVWP